MKSDFKDGVSKAAGRLSSLANSVMSSIQVREKRKADQSILFTYKMYIFFIEKIENWVRGISILY